MSTRKAVTSRLIKAISAFALLVSTASCSVSAPNPEKMDRNELFVHCCNAYKLKNNRVERYRTIGECWEKGYFGVVDLEESREAYATANELERKPVRHTNSLADPLLPLAIIALPVAPLALLDEEVNGAYDAPRICNEN